MERITKYTVYKRRYTTLYDLPPVHAKRQVKFFLYKGKKDLTTRHLSQKYMQYGYIRNNTKVIVPVHTLSTTLNGQRGLTEVSGPAEARTVCV